MDNIPPRPDGHPPDGDITQFRTVGDRARAWLFALLAVLLVFVTEQVVEHFARQHELQQEKSGVLNQVSAIRACLEGVINANLNLVYGLTAVIAAQPDVDQAGFSAIARDLVDEHHALRNIGAAPNMVISLMYPLAGNEAALGLDYRTQASQRDAALRARDSGQPVIAGPLTLQQGGAAIIAWAPVFLAPAHAGGERQFWGLVSAQIDAQTLIRQAGLDNLSTGLRLALRGADGNGSRGPVFFGEAKVFSERPVTLDVTLPGGSWQLAALPVRGWGHSDSSVDLIRLLALLAALAAGGMTYRLTRGAYALARQAAQLRAVLNTIPDLVWLKDPGGVYMTCNPRFEDLFGAREADIRGKTDRDFMPAAVADLLGEDDRAVIAAGRRCIDEEWFTFVGDGRRVLLETIKTPVTDAAGRLVGVLGIARDITAHKLAEAALRDSEAKLQLFIDHVPTALAMLDRQMRYLAVSHRWLTDYKLEGDDILGRSHYEVFPEIPARLKAVHRRGMAGEVLGANDDRFERQDGTVQWLRWEMRPWYATDGAVGGIVIFSEDVTDRKRAEMELRHQRDILNRTGRLAHVGGWEFDVATLRGSWTDETARIHDLEPSSEVTVAEGLSFYPGESRRLIEGAVQDAIESAQPYDLELEFLSAKGVRKWVRTIGLPVVEDGKVVRMQGAIQDITALKQAEAALREQEEFFRLITENMGDMVSVLDREGRLLYSSPSYCALFGDAEALKGADIFSSVHPDDRERVRLSFRTAVDTRVGQRGNFRVVLRDRSVREIESQCGVIRDAGGEVMRVVMVLRDVTERKRMEDEIRQLNTELEDRVRRRTAELATANKELETFTYSVSHDLKAPLRGIDGYSRLLLEDHQDQLNEEGRLFLKKVQGGVEQMNQLIADLLSYSRMERRSMNGRTLDLSLEVAKALDERQADIEAQGMIVEVALLGLSVRADPEGLAMVLRNLIDNALKFTRDCQPPTLSITATPCEKFVTLAIRDNGIGFDMQFHDRIFGIFQRLQRVEDYPGTGVGLAIVRKAMHRMGGRVWAESALRQGTTFNLELPR